MTETVGAKILIIDHNDSFTFNLVQMLEQAGVAEVKVISADLVVVDDLENFDGIVLSPGPGLPRDYPHTTEVIGYCTESVIKTPLLGVCLGFQALAIYFGGKLLNLNTVQHGRQVAINVLHPCPLLESIQFPMAAGLYHSWAMDPATSVPELLITSCLILKEDNKSPVFPTDIQEIPMSFRHRALPIFGVQFHPESYMTTDGEKIIRNWLSIVEATSGIKSVEGTMTLT